MADFRSKSAIRVHVTGLVRRTTCRSRPGRQDFVLMGAPGLARDVGSMWTPCRPHDPSITKALCLYLNSTPGVLSLLGARDNRKPSYPSFSLDTLRSLPVPNFAVLGDAERELLSGWFDWLENETLQPFPRMAEDPVRAQIDDAVVQVMGLDAGWVEMIRRELAREPSITDSDGKA